MDKPETTKTPVSNMENLFNQVRAAAGTRGVTNTTFNKPVRLVTKSKDSDEPAVQMIGGKPHYLARLSFGAPFRQNIVILVPQQLWDAANIKQRISTNGKAFYSISLTGKRFAPYQAITDEQGRAHVFVLAATIADNEMSSAEVVEDALMVSA